MACFSFGTDIISRGKGSSITAAVAYISGEKLRDDYTGKTHDRSYRHDVIHKEILLPQSAPREFLDRQTLLSALDASEKRVDSQMARMIKIALPNELSREMHIALTRELITESFIDFDMCADIALHEGLLDESRKPYSIEAVHERQNNPHAHIILPFRPVGKDGFHRVKTQLRYMNDDKYLVMWRERWAELQNREFERLGLSVRVSHESYAARNIDKEPTRHLGAATMAAELRGIRTLRGERHREVMSRNKERELERDRSSERIIEREMERSR